MSDFGDRFESVLKMIPVSQSDTRIIRERYLAIIRQREGDYARIKWAYLILTNIITVAGVLLAALISLEKNTWVGELGPKVIFWFTWAISILIPLSNKLLYVFNVPKKYLLGKASLEKFYSEGWSFLGGVARYREATDIDARVRIFLERIEKIQLKSIGGTPEMINDTATDILAAGAARNRAGDTTRLPSPAAPIMSHSQPTTPTSPMPPTTPTTLTSHPTSPAAPHLLTPSVPPSIVITPATRGGARDTSYDNIGDGSVSISVDSSSTDAP
jgi:hypothetical protein